MNYSPQLKMATKIFGDFLEDLPSSEEYLIVSFSPSSASFQKRWRNNGLSANFLADYLSGFLPYEDQETEAKQSEARDAISYIANELLENAMKYNNSLSSAPIGIQIHLLERAIVFQITNSILQQKVAKFQNHIQEMLDFDPYELYMTKLEQNGMATDNVESGLGFLTMIVDYGAKLGWKFASSIDDPEEQTVTTMVQISM
jgi:hypothetical protein